MNVKFELSAPQYSFLRAQTNRNLLHCGQGFGKTHIEALVPASFVQSCPNVLGLIGANTYAQLSNATLKKMFEVWRDIYGWTEWSKGNPNGFYVIGKQQPECFTPHKFTFTDNNAKIFFRNGAVIMTVSLDNFMALDGIEVGWAVLDETKDTNEKAVKEVIIARLRAKGIAKIKNLQETDLFGFCADTDARAGDAANPLFIVTSPAKERWLSDMFHLELYRDQIERDIFDPNDYFYMATAKHTVVIASAFHNQKNLPSDYIELKLEELAADIADMLVYGSPFGKIGAEYYSKFNRKKHVKSVKYTPGYPIHICLDFNVNPYMTLIVLQLIPNGVRFDANIIHEYTLSSPKNSIEAVCREFDSDYGHLCGHGLFYYGDATGQNTLPIAEMRNLYQVVEKALGHILTPASKRLLKKNVRHKSAAKGTLGRRDFMNKMLAGSYPVNMYIDPSCKNTIADFDFVKEDANGAKDKKKVEINSVMCEKYGHCSDALDGFFTWNWYER